MGGVGRLGGSACGEGRRAHLGECREGVGARVEGRKVPPPRACHATPCCAEPAPHAAPRCACSEPESVLLRDLVAAFQPHAWVSVHSGMWGLFTPWDHKAHAPGKHSTARWPAQRSAARRGAARCSAEGSGACVCACVRAGRGALGALWKCGRCISGGASGGGLAAAALLHRVLLRPLTERTLAVPRLAGGASAEATDAMLHRLNTEVLGGKCQVGPGGTTVG